jgi:23S rRNA (uracil1939-C5)-methyltransferase
MGLDGDPLGRAGSCVVFVPGAIPGERVEVEAVTSNRKFCRARLLRVLRPSAARVAPGCRHFGPCGGCTWQHIAYPEQLRLKEAMLSSLLEHALGPGAPGVKPALGIAAGGGSGADARAPGARDPEAPWGFRNKVHFTLGPGSRGRGLVMGHYRRGSRSLLEASECPVHAGAGNRLAFRARDLLRREGVSGAEGGEQAPRETPAASAGLARHLLARVAERSGETQLTIVGASARSRALERAARELAAGPGAPSGIHLNVQRRPGPFILGPVTRRLHGDERLREEVAGVAFLISPQTFFQTSIRAAEVLVRAVLDLVPGGGESHVLDLYAGAGLFSLPLAKRGARVVAVEENPAAVGDALASLRANGIPGAACRFVRGRVEDVLREVVAERGAGAPPLGAIILDPPREGCPPEVWEVILRRLRPERIIYVSCNPRALAADLPRAAPAGYAIRSVQPVDMFPHTAHIESVALLVRQAGPQSRT